MRLSLKEAEGIDSALSQRILFWKDEWIQATSEQSKNACKMLIDRYTKLEKKWHQVIKELREKGSVCIDRMSKPKHLSS